MNLTSTLAVGQHLPLCLEAAGQLREYRAVPMSHRAVPSDTMLLALCCLRPSVFPSGQPSGDHIDPEAKCMWSRKCKFYLCTAGIASTHRHASLSSIQACKELCQGSKKHFANILQGRGSLPILQLYEKHRDNEVCSLGIKGVAGENLEGQDTEA